MELDLTELVVIVYTAVVYYKPYYMHVRHGQYTNGMQRDFTLSLIKLLKEVLKIRWQYKIQDTEVRGKAGGSKRTYFLKLAQLRWTC